MKRFVLAIMLTAAFVAFLLNIAGIITIQAYQSFSFPVIVPITGAIASVVAMHAICQERKEL